MGQLPARLREILDGPNVAVLATVRPDGRPQQFLVWAKAGDDEVLLSTTEGRPKHRNLVHNPYVSLIVHPVDDPYANVNYARRSDLLVRQPVRPHPRAEPALQERAIH